MSILLILSLAIVALALATVALWRIAILQRRLAGLGVTVESCQEQVRGLASAAASQQLHLSRARRDLERLRGQLERVASGDGADPAINQAIRMARKGLGAGEIMATCGLSQMEADLVVLVHCGEGQA